MGKFWKLSWFIFIFISFSHSDVIFDTTSTKLSVRVKNNTPGLWKAGGVRFRNEGFKWTGTDNGYAADSVTNTTIGSKNEVEIIIKSNANGNEVKILPGQTFPFNHPWTNNTTGAEFDTTYLPEVLLRTGAAGKVDDPIDPDPITIDQLDSLKDTPDFYKTDYRYNYVDSLGVNGGIYSGGFLDTWYNNTDGKPETQIQIAIPLDTFTLNNFDINLDTSATKGPIYWMSLAVAQEYFRVDYQWMMAMGIKENDAGVKKQHYPNDVNYDSTTNHNSGLGPWQTEAPTGGDRALTYPNYFPKFETRLSNALDLASSGIGTFELTDYYCGVNSHINSAKIVNTMVFSILVQYANYDVFAYCTDICWKEALAAATDPYMGLSAMCAVYNGGNSKVANIAGDLNSNTYEATCANPTANTLWYGLCTDATYTPKMLVGVQNFVDASRESQTNSGVEILDHGITKTELLKLFFGDGGTVQDQGHGGLLLHFYDPTVSDCIAERQDIWNTLSDAFELLKGRAPSTSGTDMISYRYDFASILRTVKTPFRFSRRAPAGGDAVNIIIPNNSKGNYPPCGEGSGSDEKYPYAFTDTKYDVVTEDFIIFDTVKDETKVKEVTWSLDYNWQIWFDAEVIDSSDDKQKIFKITIPKTLVEEYRAKDTLGSGKHAWLLSTDEYGNSVVSKVKVPYKSPEFIDSVAAYDSNGDGVADNIKAYIQPGGNDTIENFEKMTYKWPNSNTFSTVYKGDSKVSVTGNVFTISDNSFTEGVGVGEFNMWVDTVYGLYPDNHNAATVNIGPEDILDRVGPVIDSIPQPLYVVPEDGSIKDTLKSIHFSEPIKDISNTGDYLQFKNGSGSAVTESAEEIIKVSSTEYIFIFANGTLTNYTDVKILASSDLQDEVGNSAADNNQWVPIVKQDITDPNLDFASIKDNVGDGYGNLITYKITKGSTSPDAFDFGDLDELKYKWNQSGTETDVSISSATITAEVQVDFEIDITTNGAYGHGTGDAFMYFVKTGNDPYTLTGNIIDSVGPAIVSAEYIVGKDSDPCTLTIIITEDIEDDLDAGIQYLVLGDGTKISQSAINKKSETEYEFIVSPGTIEDGDDVKLIHNSGLTDASAQKNPPLENNILQDIIYIDAINKITSVEYHDTDGKGIMNKVVINFVSSVDQTEDVDKMSFVINWLDEDGNAIAMNVAGSDFIKTDAKKIEWTVNSNNYDLMEDLTSLKGGYGHVSITQPNDNTGSDETTDYGDTIAVDKMAPVLTSAAYYKFKGAKPDELKVTYSELVSYNSMLPDGEPFDFFGNSGEYTLELEPVVDGGGFGNIEPDTQMTFIKLSGGTPEHGDSLNIDDTENLTGDDGNIQKHADNKKVFLGVFSAIGITNVSYHDISSQRDGKIDRIKVVTDTAVAEGMFSELVDKIVLNSERQFDALEVSDFSTFADANDTGFIIKVTQADGAPVKTDTSANDKFMITDEVKTSSGFMMYDTVDIQDSIAPVIIGAYHFPVEITPDNYLDLLKDTLKIEYSESVDYDVMADNPLNFKKSGGSALTVDLAKEAEEGNSVVIYMVDYNSDKPKDNDSVQISTSGNVEDKSDNNQGEDNVYVPISVAEVPFHWNIGVYPNPVLKNNDDQVNNKKKELADYLDISEDDIKKGTQAIVMDPLGPAPSSDDVEISVTIYDALGHRVVVDEKLKVSSDGEKWYYLWDGQNEKGRDVGSGIYLAYIKISPEILGTITEPLKLGVGQ